MLHTAQSPAELQDRLDRVLTRTDGTFLRRAKLSPGGIVVWLLEAPVTDQPFYGTLERRSARVAMVPPSARRVAWQPIADLTLADHGSGTQVTVRLAPHPDARTFSWLYLGAGILLLVGGGVRFSDNPTLGFALALMGGLFSIFPRLRAWHSFQLACVDTLGALREHLGLEAPAE